MICFYGEILRIQKPAFSRWFRWSDRDAMPESNLPGLYILAKFNHAPKGVVATPLSKNVIYIGETCSNSLHGRWYQFNRSAFENKDGHSGGWSYNQLYGDAGRNLYVAASPIKNIPENLRHLFIRYHERKLIFDYALKFGVQPKLNHK